ncbi:hypothetical protein RJ639_042983 [Escallonia herrerae]|uniref:Uncharacterized protein n=1 Tax=Escallonia herrerae TaxID=1293975 RepID=A0AA89B8S8_9ASTE|nr:hypothetical protein RJ639_042983 [Escallonia herrerae]
MVKGTLQRFLEIVGKKRRKGYKLLEQSDQPPIPSDCASVYVGKEHEKYIIPVACLSSVWIEALFHQYGVEIQATKPMFLPCSTRELERMLELASYGKEPGKDYYKLIASLSLGMLGYQIVLSKDLLANLLANHKWLPREAGTQELGQGNSETLFT